MLYCVVVVINQHIISHVTKLRMVFKTFIIYKAKVPFFSRVNSATTAPMEAIHTLFESLWYRVCLCQVSGLKMAFGSSFAQKRLFNSLLYKG